MKYVLLAVLFLSAVSAFAGNELGNGGDLVAQEFIAAGRQLVERLRAQPDPRIPDVDRFAAAVEKVKVTSTGKLTLHGAEVDAINYPQDQQIDVNRERWQESSPEKRASLVLHEYLGILQVNDLHYEISGAYANAFAGPEEKPKKYTVGLSATYGMQKPGFGGAIMGSSPGVSLQAAYAISRRLSVGFAFDRQSYESSRDWGKFSTTFYELTAMAKYWFTDAKTWRPYGQLNVGYSRQKSAGYFYDNQNRDLAYLWDGSWAYTGNFAMQVGAGVRYSMMKDVGLDFSLHLHSIGSPWGWKGYESWNKTLTGSAGIDVAF